MIPERQSDAGHPGERHGTLYLVATPIGNLADMTLRGIETLKAVDLIASEDTRKTGVLLRHHRSATRQTSFFEHNERASGARIIAALRSGKSVALVTSAGTPGIRRKSERWPADCCGRTTRRAVGGPPTLASSRGPKLRRSAPRLGERPSARSWVRLRGSGPILAFGAPPAHRGQSVGVAS